MKPSETVPRPVGLPGAWRLKAQLFREHHEAPVAIAYEKCANALEEALHQEGDTPLTLADAAERSGFSRDHLSRLIREGKIPNAGRKGAPRIAFRHLPRRAGLEPRPRRGHLSRKQIVRSAIGKGA